MKQRQHKSGFTVPEGYFEGFKERLRSTLGDKEVHLPKSDGFSVPDGYFAGLNDRLSNQVVLSGQKVIALHARKYWVAAAAIAAIAVLFFMLPPAKSTDTMSFDDLAGIDIADYMLDNDLELTDNEIAQLLPIEDLEINDILNSRLRDENIMDYLDDSMDELDEFNFDINE